MMDDKVKALIQWVSKNCWRESRAASPRPAFHVDVDGLLDEIKRIYGLTDGDIEAAADEAGQ